MRTVEILIPRKGISTGARAATVETSGFQGEQCKDATKFLAKLGDQVDEKLKDEFYEPVQQEHEHLGEGGG